MSRLIPIVQLRAAHALAAAHHHEWATYELAEICEPTDLRAAREGRIAAAHVLAAHAVDDAGIDGRSPDELRGEFDPEPCPLRLWWSYGYGAPDLHARHDDVFAVHGGEEPALEPAEDTTISVEEIERHTASRMSALALEPGVLQGIQAPTVDPAGRIVHVTGSGRLAWRVSTDGSVGLVVSRPAGEVLAATVDPDGSTRVERVGTAAVLGRHYEALAGALNALGARHNMGEILSRYGYDDVVDPEDFEDHPAAVRWTAGEGRCQ